MIRRGMVETVLFAVLQGLSLSPDARDAGRLETIAHEVALASTEHRPPLKGEASAEAWALAHLAIAYHESGLLPWVERCESAYPGANDGGKSWGLMQVHQSLDGLWAGRTKAEICGSRLEQLRAGGDKLAIAARHCSASPLSTFRCYTGMGRLGDKPAREILAIYERMIQKAKIRIVWSSVGAEARWAQSFPPSVAASEDEQP